MKNSWLIIPGYCVGLGGLVLITYRTVLAIVSPGKAVLVSVNSFGEQYLDLLALGFLWTVSVVGLLCLLALKKELARRSSDGSEDDSGNAMVSFPMFSAASYSVSLPSLFRLHQEDARWSLKPEESSESEGGVGATLSLSIVLGEP